MWMWNLPEKESTEIKRLLIVFVVVNFLGRGTGLPEVIERGRNSEWGWQTTECCWIFKCLQPLRSETFTRLELNLFKNDCELCHSLTPCSSEGDYQECAQPMYGVQI